MIAKYTSRAMNSKKIPTAVSTEITCTKTKVTKKAATVPTIISNVMAASIIPRRMGVEFGHVQGGANSADHHLGRDFRSWRSCMLEVSRARSNGLDRLFLPLRLTRPRPLNIYNAAWPMIPCKRILSQ